MDKIKQAFVPRPDNNNAMMPSQHARQETADKDLQAIESVTGHEQRKREDDLNPEAQKELQQLRSTLQNNIQSSRMQHHAFEPISLPGSQPASRVSALKYRADGLTLCAGDHLLTGFGDRFLRAQLLPIDDLICKQARMRHPPNPHLPHPPCIHHP